MTEPDVVIIGSGPNGLSAAVALAQAGAAVVVLEARDDLGGGTRTAELTLPGFHHDVCSAVHPMGILSPYLRTLPLAEHGLHWICPPASVAHPLDDGPAVLLRRSLDETIANLDPVDAATYRRMVEPFLGNPHGLLRDALAPLGMPRHPLLMLRFGLQAIRSTTSLARRFRGDRARALLAGCAGHAIQPLEHPFTAALALMFLITGHVENWPVAAGGSASISRALASLLAALGGRTQTGTCVQSLDDLPAARLYLFDTSPAQLATIGEPVLPPSYVRRLRRYRYGPGTFKLDFALSRSIPWRDSRCLEASTVHLGGTLEEIAAAEAAVWRGEHPERPYLLVSQQSEFDRSRAPQGQHTGWAYCHVPSGSTVDLTDVVERQIERFAPGFRDCILARRTTTCADFEQYNPNFVGGAVTGGVADWSQLFTRPVARWNLDPYTTPNPRVLICSASTPPGGGVHGMCGYHAAQTALRRLSRFRVSRLRAD
ncbi:MAG: NAD(P)/FAD-dependent oxidoreductase [Pirellulales bacterium]|nr:NAD(P)/FAD-dependent oxidoreductase [Pirellulales bacterium]